MSTPPTLPSGVAYAPPPPVAPPPPPGWPPAPGYPGWFVGPPAPPTGELTRRAVDSLHDALTYYLVYLVLTFVAALVSGIATGGVALSSAGPLSSSLGTGGSGGLGLSSANRLIVEAIGGVFALVAFILLIISWVTWHTGATRLESGAAEFGPEAARAAERAKKQWLYTTLVFIFGIIASVVVVFAIILASLSASFRSVGNNTTAITQAVSTSILEVAVAVAVLSVLISFLTYWFATDGFVGGLLPISTPAMRADLSSARTVILVGAVLSVLSITGYFVPFGGLVGLLSPALLLYGFWKMRGVYATWLGSPPRPGGLPTPATPTYPPWPH